MRLGILIGCLIFLTPARAGVAISDVVNYGSRVGSGLPSSGIAQGSLFAVIGSGLGPDKTAHAHYPLPTSLGLHGVTVDIAIGRKTLSAIMVAVGPNEVDAILPSKTPLGPGVLTVHYKETSASYPVTIVKSAFGMIFNAGAFNVEVDGAVTPNSGFQSAHPGQKMIVRGTGLGPIKGDETRKGLTEIPDASVRVWVGTSEAKVISARRGDCCGSDPAAILNRLAALDLIEFVVPAGLDGCNLSVHVQAGDIVSNSKWISVSKAGDVCPEVAAYNNGQRVNLVGLTKTSQIQMIHEVTPQSDKAAQRANDSASLYIQPIDFSAVPAAIPDFWIHNTNSVGSCSVTTFRINHATAVEEQSAAPAAATFDAGQAFTIKAPNVTQTLANDGTPPVAHYGAFATTVTLATAGGTSFVSGDPPFLPSGPFTLDNGRGGPDLAPFMVTLRNPSQVRWENIEELGTIDRTSGFTVKWSGGDPDGIVSISGGLQAVKGTVSYGAAFTCASWAASREFTVPPFVMKQVPVDAQPVQSNLRLGTLIESVVAIPGIDFTYYSSSQAILKPVVFH